MQVGPPHLESVLQHHVDWLEVEALRGRQAGTTLASHHIPCTCTGPCLRRLIRRWVQGRWGVGWGEVRWGEVGWGEVRWGEVRSGQVIPQHALKLG